MRPRLFQQLSQSTPRPGLAVGVEAGDGDVGVAEPFLDACDVGFILEGGGGRGPEGIDAEPRDVEPGCPGVVANHPVVNRCGAA
jgi:hypothetical protein